MSLLSVSVAMPLSSCISSHSDSILSQDLPSYPRVLRICLRLSLPTQQQGTSLLALFRQMIASAGTDLQSPSQTVESLAAASLFQLCLLSYGVTFYQGAP